MIKNIIFDIGNVLVSYRPVDYMKQLDFEEEERNAILEAIFQSKYWLELDRGTLTQEEAVDKFCELAPSKEQGIKKVMEHWMDMLVPMPETIAIFKELKARGYKLFVLSNYHKAAYARIVSENDFFTLLDGKTISYEVNLIKPEKEIYERIIEDHNLLAEETLFIDDTKANIEGARLCNIRTYLFESPELFKEYLISHQIL
ncbi:MAG: family phosphatase [Herbinix sp.]|nr:family phosphatase [Herbinix sp.]